MPHDPHEILGEVARDLVAGVVRGGAWLFGLGSQERTRRRAAAKALADERASRERQREWHEAVARQKARGHAGFASEADARAALNGKGGRPSKLDGRKF